MDKALSHGDNSSFSIPFVFGVTGHRDLRPEDVPGLEDRVRAIFSDFRQCLPSTPFLLLSALASGADQLVSRVALQNGAQLVAVLPMPAEIYKSGMAPEAQRSFDLLLAKASVVITFPLDGKTEMLVDKPSEARAESYDALGRFLATHSQTLIALWDGKRSEKRGGTACVIRYMLEGTTDTNLSSEELQAGIVYHILTPRSSYSTPEGKLFELRLLTSLEGTSDQDMEDFAVLAQRLEAFNRDMRQVEWAAIPACGNLIPEDVFRLLSAYGSRISRIFFAADKCSLDFNNWASIALATVLAFAFVALASFELYAHVLPHNAALWLGYPIALLGAWLTYRYTRKREVETKYFDYRALAEALRVQFFWSLAGIRESVADHYLRDHRTELDWIRYALRSVAVFQHSEDEQKADEMHRLELVLNHWVEKQSNWYTAKARRQQRILRLLNHITGRSLLTVWLVSTLVPLSFLIPWRGLVGWQTWALEQPRRGILLLLVLLPSLLIGLFRVWVEQAGYDVQARKYHRMAQLFRRSCARLQEFLRTKRIDEAREVVRQLGIDALDENGEWLLLHRERPLKVVA
jgi:hypothetical protein